MESAQLSFRPGFRLSVGNVRSQGAVMVLPAGGREGGPNNNHRGADQWLFVVEGTGAAIINGHKTILKAGMMVLIEAGDRIRAACLSRRGDGVAGGARQMRNRHFGQDVAQIHKSIARS